MCIQINNISPKTLAQSIWEEPTPRMILSEAFIKRARSYKKLFKYVLINKSFVFHFDSCPPFLRTIVVDGKIKYMFVAAWLFFKLSTAFSKLQTINHCTESSHYYFLKMKNSTTGTFSTWLPFIFPKISHHIFRSIFKNHLYEN